MYTYIHTYKLEAGTSTRADVMPPDDDGDWGSFPFEKFEWFQ